MIFAFFGYNESFAGEAGLDEVQERPRRLHQAHARRRSTTARSPRGWSCSRRSPTRTCNDRNLPDGKENNERLELYTAAMAEVAKAQQRRRSSICSTRRTTLYAKADEPLTINGVHLNERGQPAARRRSSTRRCSPTSPSRKRDAEALEKLRQAVLDKNFYWFNRYRTVDGYSIYGGRADLQFVDGQTNYEVVQREMEVLDVMTANRDKRDLGRRAGRAT